VKSSCLKEVHLHIWLIICDLSCCLEIPHLIYHQLQFLETICLQPLAPQCHHYIVYPSSISLNLQSNAASKRPSSTKRICMLSFKVLLLLRWGLPTIKENEHHLQRISVCTFYETFVVVDYIIMTKIRIYF
jgi:hypothetical protein